MKNNRGCCHLRDYSSSRGRFRRSPGLLVKFTLKSFPYPHFFETHRSLTLQAFFDQGQDGVKSLILWLFLSLYIYIYIFDIDEPLGHFCGGCVSCDRRIPANLGTSNNCLEIHVDWASLETTLVYAGLGRREFLAIFKMINTGDVDSKLRVAGLSQLSVMSGAKIQVSNANSGTHVKRQYNTAKSTAADKI